MPIQTIQNSAYRANTKYRRIRTLIKNCVEVAGLCDIKINLVILDNNGDYVQENFTDPDVAVKTLMGRVQFDDTILNKALTSVEQNRPKIPLDSRNATERFVDLTGTQKEAGPQDKPQANKKWTIRSKTILKYKTDDQCRKDKTMAQNIFKIRRAKKAQK